MHRRRHGCRHVRGSTLKTDYSAGRPLGRAKEAVALAHDPFSKIDFDFRGSCASQAMK
ncbi:hypothetical protein BQ8482_350069 [Mesorhizobium delmotii]|uniref:Uncharacterized protein n=1 Tax=Mesorhizobium delmotii TaxID=1631247 RepID=A0A2P9AQK4_9HYPH|nr:hypothetical protein BQ8482_350069 [Mesorhizobium delmotii]